MATEFPPQTIQESNTRELDELRDLLLGPEKRDLHHIKKRLDDPTLRALEISRVLPEAISHRLTRDKKLSKALQPVIDESVDSYLRTHSQAITDAIVPVMGESLKTALYIKVRNKLESINDFFVRNFSPKGIRWRMESIRSKKSMDEIIHFHTLRYRVEQVFIIHRDSGTVLQHVSEFKDEAIEEASMFSETLKAIQASASHENDPAVNSLQLGNHTVWVEQGNRLMLAGVIRGTPSYEIRQVFKKTLTKIENDFREEINTFDGDASLFHSCEDQLKSCLKVEYGKKDSNLKPLWVVTACLLFLLSIWGYFTIRENILWNRFIYRLNSAHGIVITKHEKIGNRYYINGLKDPMAINPSELLAEIDIDPKRVTLEWEPYFALHPDIVSQRARKILEAPETVSFRSQDGVLYASGLAPESWIKAAQKKASAIPGIIRLEEDNLFDLNASELFLARVSVQLEPPQTVFLNFNDGTLTVTGSAPHQWIKKMKQKVHTMPGIVRVNDTNLVDIDVSELAMIKERIESHVFLFRIGGATPVPNQEKMIETLSGEIAQLNEIISKIGRGHVEIVGHTDNTGSERANLKVSQNRAETVLTLLREKGTNTRYLTAIGVGDKEPLRKSRSSLDREMNRSVTFRVLFH
ncbi:flagellar motor protein MotB [Candidatus Magnetomorum sp. HK-1]|nr:flagellar motor protein MotB [Candidatus Magnetomorum sp. HK-1]